MHGAVIGSGVAGIAIAHALRRVGIGVDLLEREPEPRSTGYQLNVLANGMHALSKIGLLKGLRASGVGAPLRSSRIVDGPTGALVRDLPVSGVDTEYAPSSFYRGDLHRWLPQRFLNRFENHVLKYAIGDPQCPIEPLD